MTPLDLIHLSLKLSNVTGIGQTPDAEDVNDCFIVMIAMLQQWNRKRWLIPNEIDTGLVTTGSQFYSLGPGGDFDIRRPDKIMAAYVRLLPTQINTVDIALGILAAPEEYSAVVAKNIKGFPSIVFYDSTYPMGKVWVYPVAPSGQFELHLITKGVLQVPKTITEELVIPDEMLDPLLYNLACRVRPIFGASPDQTLIQLAKMGLNTLRQANSQVPHMSMPAGIGRWRSGRWQGHGVPNWASLG